MAGSGKSTLCREFEKLGVMALDIDKGFARWVNRETGETAPYSTDEPMIVHHDWLADAEKMQHAIDQENVPVWFFGSAHNLHTFQDMFKHVFLLSYPNEDAIRHRILTRAENDYGKAPGELDGIIGYWKSYEQNFENMGTTVIDCTLPVEKIIEKIREVAS
ncbi:hypothetical protein LCH21_03460 [Patescibacteria group bacterium]|nr:hypothetical protein [Patescibacteria group bacterium]